MGTGRPMPRDFDRHPYIAERIRPLFPRGTDIPSAAAGFRNTGQFVAATHVSHNLGIPFGDLKTRMMAGDSLGQAIQNLRPDLSRGDSRRYARDAERRAKQDMREWSRRSTRTDRVEQVTGQPGS